jgi:hypothetical protein
LLAIQRLFSSRVASNFSRSAPSAVRSAARACAPTSGLQRFVLELPDTDLERADLRVQVLPGLRQEVPLAREPLLPLPQVRRGLREFHRLRGERVPLFLHLVLPHGDGRLSLREVRLAGADLRLAGIDDPSPFGHRVLPFGHRGLPALDCGLQILDLLAVPCQGPALFLQAGLPLPHVVADRTDLGGLRRHLRVRGADRFVDLPLALGDVSFVRREGGGEIRELGVPGGDSLFLLLDMDLHRADLGLPIRDV